MSWYECREFMLKYYCYDRAFKQKIILWKIKKLFKFLYHTFTNSYSNLRKLYITNITMKCKTLYGNTL